MYERNCFAGRILEFHILQSFPTTCLNRDDIGSPKTAIVAGVNRARVSSQCWKRAVRMEMQRQGISIATRSKYLLKKLVGVLQNQGATEDEALACSEKVMEEFYDVYKKDKKNKDSEASKERTQEKDMAILFMSDSEMEKVAEYCKLNSFDSEKIESKKIIEIIKDVKAAKVLDGLDMALFGRMVAKNNQLNIEGASAFSHALSTHRVDNESDFFTAVDDLTVGKTDSCSSHLGNTDFNSATYYRYVRIDLGLLYENLGGANMAEALEAFTRALFTAVPSARQNSMAGFCPWEYARILIRKGQALELPLSKPVTEKGEGYLGASKAMLQDFILTKEKQFGSMYGKQLDLTFDDNTCIDDIVTSISQEIGRS